MATDPDAISLLIEGKRLAHWLDAELTFGLDTYSTVSFTAPFDASSADFRKIFRPFSFSPVEVMIGDREPLFTGSMLTPIPHVNGTEKIVEVPAYSKPAIIEDCCPPGDFLDKHSLQFEKVTLQQISDTLTAPFGVLSEFAADAGAPFEKVKMEVTEKVQAFLVELAKQRQLVMTSTPEGKLKYWQTVATGNPVVHFEQGVPPLTIVTPTFNPQDYCSEMTGFTPWQKRKAGAKATVLNPHLRRPRRPLTFRFEDTEKGDAPAVTKAAMGRMFGNIVSYTIEDLPTWRDPDGRLWRPNTTLTLKAPDAMIYSPFEFCIRSVLLKTGPRGKTASLDIVLPGAFSGVIPEKLPWD